MNGLPKISDTIPRCGVTLEQRGLPAHSFFEAVFADESVITEKEANWSAMSHELRVAYFGDTKTVRACTEPLARLMVHHGGLVAELKVPEGCEGYQAVRSETVILNGRKTTRVIGRSVGIIKDGEVLEEQFINGIENAVMGTRK